MAHLAPAGRCCNYTIWQGKAFFFIDEHQKVVYILNENIHKIYV